MAYRIRTVSEMTGIPRNTLIAWERRYGFIKPERHENSYRDYSDADVAKLKKVKQAIGQGLSVSEAIALTETSSRAANGHAPTRAERSSADGTRRHAGGNANEGTRTLGSEHAGKLERPALAPSIPGFVRREQRQGPPESAAANDAARIETAIGAEAVDAFASLRGRLLAALSEYRGKDADRLMLELVGVNHETRIHQVFFPVLREIGELWQAGKFTVAQEHYAAQIIREQMIAMWVSLGRNEDAVRHATCTTFPGDMHELGAMALAVRLGHAGYRVSYLGPNLPASELAGFCRSSAPELVCVSAILRQKADQVAHYLRSLRELVPAPIRIVVGGRGIDVTPELGVQGVELIPDWDDFDLRLGPR